MEMIEALFAMGPFFGFSAWLGSTLDFLLDCFQLSVFGFSLSLGFLKAVGLRVILQQWAKRFCFALTQLVGVGVFNFILLVM